ncbi:MAG: hypothetical protein LCI00_02200 [Chloroflexi bacterium]|nr:hypothetical protein [Chloroflexota bacterium]
MFRRFAVMVSLLILASAFVAVEAQDDISTIGYGQTVNGTITNKNFEVSFDFEGKKGDVFIIEMTSDDASEFTKPQIIVLNSEGDVEGDSSGNYGYGEAFFAGQMSQDDTLTILATRADGRSGEGVGDFTLSVINPTLLNTEELLEDSVTSGKAKYYRIDKVDNELSLTYRKSSGEFSPEVSVNVISESYGLNTLVTLAGDYLTNVETQLPDIEGTYIVKIDEAAFDYNFKEVSAKFELQLNDKG